MYRTHNIFHIPKSDRWSYRQLSDTFLVGEESKHISHDLEMYLFYATRDE